jgi:hypothetical protein
MNAHELWWRRLALITALAERAPNRVLGRVAIVKMAYLLQVVRGVPLGYDFRLYTYGPFDAEVLNDLGQAQTLKAVEVGTVQYKAGYGYEVRPGPAAEAVKARAPDWLAERQQDIDWVVGEFGGWTAADLELSATIIYVDRELVLAAKSATVQELAQRVHEVKPHFAEGYIVGKVQALQQKGLLSAVR